MRRAGKGLCLLSFLPEEELDVSIPGLVVLIFLSAFFSGSEIALISLSKLKIMHLVEQKRKNAHILERLKENPHRLLITILVGNNLANMGASALATSYAIGRFDDFGISVVIGLLTLAVLVFGEIAPKAYCIRYAESIALLVSPAILAFSYLFYPITLGLDFISNLINKLGPASKDPMITEGELRTIIKVSEGEGSIDTEEGEMIHRVLELNDITVEEVMTPRPDMYTLEWTSKIKDVLPEIIDSGFSRIPIFARRVDKTKGVVYVKDLLKYIAEEKGETMLKEIMKPVLYVPANMFINSMLKLFKQKKRHIAMVVDEYGGMQGLVTIEDILEELVGEIYDESDIPESLITKVDSKIARVSGKASLDDVNEALDLSLEENDDYETISGFVLHKLGRIPLAGEEVDMDNLTIKVELVEENRIKELSIIKKEQPEPLV